MSAAVAVSSPVYIAKLPPLDERAAYRVSTHSIYGTKVELAYRWQMSSAAGRDMAAMRRKAVVKVDLDIKAVERNISPQEETAIAKAISKGLNELLLDDMLSIGI
jgi:hypothetical protein